MALSVAKTRPPPWRLLVPLLVTALTTPPAALPYSAEKFEALTWNSRTASWLMVAVARVRPRSSDQYAVLLSPPSTVLLFNKPEMPRKEMRPKEPSGAAPGVLSAKLE